MSAIISVLSILLVKLLAIRKVYFKNRKLRKLINDLLKQKFLTLLLNQ